MGIQSTRLFVYGTLRRAVRNSRFDLLDREATFLGPAAVPGRLIDLGAYPGLAPPDRGGQWVRGELYRLHDPARLLPRLDEYEGPEFERVETTVRLHDGRRPTAWVYRLVAPRGDRPTATSSR